MTIVTKPLSEKKEENKPNKEPLLEEVKVICPAPGTSCGSNGKKFVHSKEHVRLVIKSRVIPTYISMVFVLSLLLICLIPILATLLRDAIRAKVYHDWCSIPYQEFHGEKALHHQSDQAQLDVEISNSLYDKIKKLAHNMMESEKFFKEEFEIDDASEKITVPDFNGGRRSKFIHDFKTNKTGIIDLDGNRCFVLPLNRSAVLPPGGLIDLITKMNSGYYDVDTSVLRETMKVVLPAVENRAEFGASIMTECSGYPIYRLEKYVSGVYKRSANSVDEKSGGKFVVFSGKGTQEFSIMNYENLDEHEMKNPVAMP